MRRVAELLRTWAMRAGGVSQAAHIVGETLPNFLGVLRGRRGISRERLDRWLRLLGASPSERITALELYIRSRSSTEMAYAIGMVDLERTMRRELEASLAAEQALGHDRNEALRALRAKVADLTAELDRERASHAGTLRSLALASAELRRAQAALRRYLGRARRANRPSQDHA